MCEGRRVCYIHDNESERRQVIGRILESGLLANEKVLCLTDAKVGANIDLKEPRPGALTVPLLKAITRPAHFATMKHRS